MPSVSVAPGVTSPKTCYYAFGGASATLASPVKCTTGTCVEVFDSCGTVLPPTYVATASYQDVTFASGTFANSSFVDCSCKAFDTTSAAPKDCRTYFVTSDHTWSTNSSGGLVLNMYATLQSTGAASDSYVTVKCEGRAP